MIHPYILCLCEEAAVIADKKLRGLPKIPLDVCVYSILLLLFPTKVNIQQSPMGQDETEPSWEEVRGYLPALRY